MWKIAALVPPENAFGLVRFRQRLVPEVLLVDKVSELTALVCGWGGHDLFGASSNARFECH